MEEEFLGVGFLQEEEAEFLSRYAKYKIKASASGFLSGDMREFTFAFCGRKEDDLAGSVKSRFLSELNALLRKHPKYVDDTKLVFEASQKSAKYEEGKDGSAKLVLEVEIALA